MNIGKHFGDYLAGLHPQPFDWRQAHCGHFAGAWVQRMEGVDPLAGLPELKDVAAARRLINRRGGMGALVTACLAREAIPVGLAQVGDVVLFEVPDGPTGGALGVCNGITSVVLDEAGAAVFVPTASAAVAWRLQPAGGVS